MKIKTQKEIVTKLLDKYPDYRDNDNSLVCHIWANKIGVERFKSMTAHQLLKIYASGSLPSHDAITRCARKVKELNPALKGKDKSKEEEEVKKELRNFNN